MGCLVKKGRQKRSYLEEYIELMFFFFCCFFFGKGSLVDLVGLGLSVIQLVSFVLVFLPSSIVFFFVSCFLSLSVGWLACWFLFL